MLPIYRLNNLVSFWPILFVFSVNGQNLLKNGSFEDYSPVYCDRISSYNLIDTLPALYWYSIDKGKPEYYRVDTVLNNCWTEKDLWYFNPELFNTINSIDGKAWMGICLFVWDGYSVYSGDADPRSGDIDPLSGLTSFWHCQNGTV